MPAENSAALMFLPFTPDQVRFHLEMERIK